MECFFFNMNLLTFKWLHFCLYLFYSNRFRHTICTQEKVTLVLLGFYCTMCTSYVGHVVVLKLLQTDFSYKHKVFINKTFHLFIYWLVCLCIYSFMHLFISFLFFSHPITRLVPLRYNDLFFSGSLDKTGAKESPSKQQLTQQHK